MINGVKINPDCVLNLKFLMKKNVPPPSQKILTTWLALISLVRFKN